MIDLLECRLSSWSGKAKHCAWCDKGLEGRQRSWCSRACYLAFLRNHNYTSARAYRMSQAKGKCSCPPEKLIIRDVDRKSGDVSMRKIQHKICVMCKRCDHELAEAGEILECNHIAPRLGDKSTMSCNHHQVNLEPLCHSCHLGVTKEQRVLWAKPKPKEKTLAKEVPKQRHGYNDHQPGGRRSSKPKRKRG